MGTFIIDKLQHLNNDLVQLFHLDTQALLDDHSHSQYSSDDGDKRQQSHGDASSSSPSSAEQADRTLMTGLRASVANLDFRSGVLPPMEKILIEIEKAELLLSTASESAHDFNGEPRVGGEAGGEALKLEHLFVAKCTVAIYLNLLDIILNATLPLSTEILYWQSLLDNPSWRLVYILQTSPYRLFSMTRSVAISTREHIDTLIATTANRDANHRQSHILQLIQYFPTFLKEHLISQPVSFPVAIHYEITHHRRQLQRIKEYQAECLGLLAEQGLNLDPELIDDSNAAQLTALSSSSTPLPSPGAGGFEPAEQFLQEQISKTVFLMERVLDQASKDTHHLADPQLQLQKRIPSKKAVARSLTILGNLQGVSNLNIQDTLKRLKALAQVQIPRYVEQTEIQARQFHRPSWLTRVWIPALMGYFGLKYGLQYITEHRADLDEFLEEAWDTARRFVTDWVWEPSMRVMNIIRHSDDQGSLQMLGNESLKSDIASLERMVLDFGKERYHMGPEELEALSQAVHNGDISVVMRAYEHELKTPLKGAVVGHLVQTLLIQVQKTKVDVEVAMAALDKLLKANELNFAFLAVGPSLLLLWAVTAQIKSSWKRASGRNLGMVSVQMRNSLRQVERLLNLASVDGDSERRSNTHDSREHREGAGPELSEDYDSLSNASTPSAASASLHTSEPLSSALEVTTERLARMRAKKGMVPYRTQGLILCEVHLLRTFAARLTRSGGLRDKVMEDLREIEESSLTVHQRLRSTKRMYRTYGFLGLYH
ncbi:Nuclear control of ATPase protein 2 [Mortierella polycephala]|uniref:Nuclear control of ATPase protein 2 n=1 Tax=Mortierella polycephala TaxID=41804 RepID=A0A9P6QAZ0_9FUNG|nr:Nuclear control of ATPase protein 2 [Mortierella polycephala]